MDGSVVIGTDLDTENFDAQMRYIEDKLNNIGDQLKQADMGYEVGDVLKLEAEYERLSNKLVRLRKNKEDFGKEKISTQMFDGIKEKIDNVGHSLKNLPAKVNFNGVSKQINSVGKSMTGLVKNVFKWGLALFGIRTAYNAIRSAMSTVSQYNEGIANQTKFMSTVLATALEPVIKKIISLVYTLLSFINSIVLKLTGKNLFEAAKKNLSSGSKSAKEIKKQLAGFDEMNVLSDNSSSGGGGGFDTSGFVEENSKLRQILEDFRKMFEEGDWAGIAQKISAGIISGLNGISEKIKSIDWTGIGKAISEFLTNIDFSGIFVALVSVFGEAMLAFQDLMLAIDWPTVLKNFGTGIANAIAKITEYIQQIRWEDIGKMLTETFAAIPWGDIGSNILTALWEAISGIIDLFLAIDWGQVAKSISDAVNKWIETIVDIFVSTDWKKLGEDITTKIFDFIENVDWIELGKNILLGIGEGIIAMVDFFIGVWEVIIKKLLEYLGIHSPSTLFAGFGKDIMQGLINGLKTLINAVINIFKDIVSKVKSVFSTVVNWIRNNIINPIINLFREIGTKVGNVIGGSFKSVVNGVLGSVEKILNTPIKTINSLIKEINTIPGINIKKLGTFNLPRLAKGGIINMPGRGVPVGSAIAGERGAEGVIPLTDSQQMALLGEAIGKYITINANITNTMNGRVISRELQKVQNESDFAYNR